MAKNERTRGICLEIAQNIDKKITATTIERI